MSEAAPGYRATIRAEMARRDLTLVDLGRPLGLSPQAMSRRLLGQVPLRAHELQTIADFLGVPASVLLGEDDRAVAS